MSHCWHQADSKAHKLFPGQSGLKINYYGNFNNLKVPKYFISAQQACPLEDVVGTTSNTTSNTTSTSYCSLQDINMVCTANTDQPSTEMVRQLLTTWELTSHVFFPQGRCHCRKDMKWNSEAKECQVPEFRKGCCTKDFASLHISFSQQISHRWSFEDFHGRGLFDDHVRDSALPRNIVRGGSSQGKPGRG